MTSAKVNPTGKLEYPKHAPDFHWSTNVANKVNSAKNDAMSYARGLKDKAHDLKDKAVYKAGSVKSAYENEVHTIAQNFGVNAWAIHGALVALVAGTAAATAWVAARAKKVGSSQASKEMNAARKASTKLSSDDRRKLAAKGHKLKSASTKKEELENELNQVMDVLTE